MAKTTRGPLRGTLRAEVLELAASLGLGDELAQGHLRCAFCNDHVGIDNLFALFPDDETIGVVCDRPDCVREFLLHAQRVGLQ